MLQNIRDNSQGWIAKTIIGVIVALMALTGFDAIFQATSTSQDAAKVNGEEVTQVELSQAVDMQRRQLLQQLGIGEAIVTVMSEKGAPTPVAWTKIWAPTSQMGPTEEARMQAMVTAAEALLKPYLEEARNKQNVEDIYMLLTDVPKEESVVICTGRYAAEVLSNGFESRPAADGSWTLPGVVSRKKQFIPAMMSAYQEL